MLFEKQIKLVLSGIERMLPDLAAMIADELETRSLSVIIEEVDNEDPPPDNRARHIIVVSVATPFYRYIGVSNGLPLYEKDFSIPKASIGMLLECYVEKLSARESDEGDMGPVLLWELTRNLAGDNITGFALSVDDAHVRP